MSLRPPLLEGIGLTRTYTLGAVEVPALRGVDFALEAGEFVVLEGPSGSGKTTLLNLLGLLDSPDAGELRWEGRPLTTLDDDACADLRLELFGYVFQTYNLIAVLNATENVELPMLLRGIPARQRRSRSAALLAAVGLRDKIAIRPDLLSGGQRQRVAIARALANDAKVLLADEPTANLDRIAADEILDLLTALNRERGVACVVATHDPRVRVRARRVVALRDGLVEDGA